MPDQFGFLLPWDGRVECAECGAELPQYADERERRAHHRAHERARHEEATRRERVRLAESKSRLRQVNRLRKEARA